MAELSGDRNVIALERSLARADPNRALGWSAAFVTGGHVTWTYLLRVTFQNPPRLTSRPLMDHFYGLGIGVRMITGDGMEAAVHISRAMGIIRSDPRAVEILVQTVWPSGDLGLEKVHSYINEGLASGRALNVPVCLVIEGSQLKKLISSGLSGPWLQDGSLAMVIYRTRSTDKAFIVSATQPTECVMMGDAANDQHALALPQVLSVCLAHGAAPCRVASDLIIEEPGDLIDAWTTLRGMLLGGSVALFGDVCFLGGLCATMTWVGVWAQGFNLMRRGFLYNDPYNTTLMMVFSTGIYSPSICAMVMARYAGMGADQKPEEPQRIVLRGVRQLLVGVLLGGSAGFLIEGFRLPYGAGMLFLIVGLMLILHLAQSSDCSVPSVRRGGKAIRVFVNAVNWPLTRLALLAAYAALLLYA